MKVLMTVDAIGGVWTYTLELMKALENDGVTFLLAAMGAALSSEQRAKVGQLGNVELFESTFLLEWMPDPWDEVDRAGEWLLDLEAKLNPDVVHLNGYAHGSLPWRTQPLVVAHSCVISWWHAVRTEAAPAWLREYRQRAGAGLRGAGKVVAPTRAMLETVLANYGPLPDTQVIPNGRSSGLYRVAAKEPVIASVGRVWDQGKNIQALARIGDELDWPIYIAGDSGGSAERAAAQPANVHMLGVLPPQDVGSLLSRASIYALPARYEPFGLSVLEAAYSGCALLLGDIASLRENWDGFAVFVDPYDDQAIRRGLQGLIADAPRRMHSSGRATAHARRFQPHAMAAAYLNTYIELSLRTALRGETCAS